MQQYYNNPYYSEGLKLKPWFTLTEEERSYIVYNAYKARVLASDDVKGYLRTTRIHHIANFVFPIVAYPILKRSVFKYASNLLYFKQTAAQSAAWQVAILGASWIAWVNFSPLYFKMVNEREDLLKLCEKRLSFKLLDLNDVLPRWKSVREIHRQFQQLYNERNSVLAGYIYPLEESAEPLVDLKSFPRRVREKIVK